jgi:hypothetical protein
MGFKFPFYKFRCVVHAKNFDAFTRESFGSRTEVEERLIGFVTSFQKIKENVTRMATYEKNKITIAAKGGGEWATNIAVDAFKNAGGSVRCFVWKGEAFYVRFGAYGTRVKRRVVRGKAVNSRMEAFNAYVPHEAVQKPGCWAVREAAVGEIRDRREGDGRIGVV